MGSYRDLRTWQQAVELAIDIYRITKKFPREEIYGLTIQLRRAAVSISSNIAEGKGRSSDRELVQFLHHARGSLQEVETQLLIAKQLNYLDSIEAEQFQTRIDLLGKGLNALINTMRSSEAA